MIHFRPNNYLFYTAISSYNTNIYTATQKFGISMIFMSLFCSSRLYLFNQKYRKKTVILWNPIEISNIGFLFYYTLKYNLFLWCSAEFSASLLMSSVSHDPSEIILICWFIMSVETVVLFHIVLIVFLTFINQNPKKSHSPPPPPKK